MAAEEIGEIYSATYSNVPVYELKLSGDHVMRRRSDDWINATHILKVAGFDKPARTRILEREVQKGVHEKIQGGYGKYQGTWVPLADGRSLAEKNSVLYRLSKIFEFVPGDKSPPPAPKHTTAASNRPKAPKAPVQPRKTPSSSYYRPAAEQFDNASTQLNEDESPEDITPESASFLGEDDLMPMSQTSTGSRKRKRGIDNGGAAATEIEHEIYGGELLDYFIAAGDDSGGSLMYPPVPPAIFNPNKPIDNHGNNALHWACSMGDVVVAKDLIARGANHLAPNEGSGETPLIRAVLFTNNYDKQSFPKIVQILQHTIMERDWHGATVFHHIAETARSRSKWAAARYYCEVLINKLIEIGSNFVQSLLMSQDKDHDTAVLRAVRNGCIKVATFLLNYCPEAGDIPNLEGETANELLRSLSQKRHSLEQPPSSPLQAGESFGRRNGHRSRRPSQKPAVSRAASGVLSKVGPFMEEASQRLASMYDTEMMEKDSSITEVKQALLDLEAQRHRIRQETFALMAKAEDDSKLNQLRGQYEACIRENESFLEQKDHAILQVQVLNQDQQVPPQAFRSANPRSLNSDEMRAALPWAMELYRQQVQRRRLVRDVAHLMGEAGTGEKIGKHRKLVAMATGLKEEELDVMSGELLDSLNATQGSVGNGPNTPQLSSVKLG